MTGMTFNGVEKDYVKVLRGRERPPWAPVERELIEVTGHPGGYLSNTKVKPRIITVPILIQANDFADLQKLKEDVADWLITEAPEELIFDDEPDRIYYAVVEGELNLNEIVRVGYGVIRFICPDPYKYSPEQTKLFPSDAVNLTNDGTADAKPIFELEVLKPVTFAMVQNHNEEYMMIGRPTDVDEEVVDAKRLLLDEDGSTLSTWDKTPIKIEGDVGGEFSTDGAGITAPTYGTSTRWHGPALIKEVDPVQDFEIEMRFQLQTNAVSETGRIEFYMFDEGMVELGKMSIIDNSIYVERRIAEGRIGPFVEDFQNYIISSRNYQYEWDNFPGLVRVRRTGNKFEFYVARIGGDGVHRWPLTASYTVSKSEYLGRLKYIQIHIGKHANSPSPHTNRIVSIKAYELHEETTDKTQYIAYPGDLIRFDHVDDEIMVNGEDRKDLKDFGSNYFKLAKGVNQLIVHPADSFDVKCKYRRRFR